MKLIDNRDSRDPCVNLALEEYCVRNLDMTEPYLLLYVNRPAVILGKHQNALEEINLPYVRDRGIRVVRRISGGGAVYHDLGNLNFSFIRSFTQGEMLRFEEYTRPVIRALLELGIRAGRGERNELTVEGRKISGNAQFTTTRSMISHGTLLFDSRLEDVAEALRPNAAEIESRGVKSVRSAVANISEFLGRRISLERFREHLVRSFFQGAEPAMRRLREDEWAEVHRLADTVYRTWEWNFGMSPPFRILRRRRLPGGVLEARIDVREGRIEAIRFSGEGRAGIGTEALGGALAGVCYRPESIRDTLADIGLPVDLTGFFHD